MISSMILEINLPNFGGQIWEEPKMIFFIRMYDGLLHTTEPTCIY